LTVPDDIPQTFFRFGDTSATRTRSTDAVDSTSRGRPGELAHIP
jgi:hypothetical protein